MLLFPPVRGGDGVLVVLVEFGMIAASLEQTADPAATAARDRPLPARASVPQACAEGAPT
jgi:hypothetical protein